MKTLSRRFRFILLGVIVIIVVASCCNFPFPLIKDTTSCFAVGNSYVELGHPLRHNIRKDRYGTYVEWKNKGDFDKALARVRDHHGKICICVLLNSGERPYKHEFNNDCSSDYDCPLAKDIRTVKVTKSKAADNIAAAESAVNDPNITYRIQSPSSDDIIAVLGTLK